MTMQVRDRIREFRRVKAGSLRPHPKNWRTHPDTQKNALRGVLAEIGYAGALVAREMPDGALELIDGHLRAETTPDMDVPVLVVDLDDGEAAKLLALHDPLAGLAESDGAALADLLREVHTENEAVQAVVDGLLRETQPPGGSGRKPDPLPLPEVGAGEMYQVVVECRDEEEQRALFERLSGEGYTCRLLNL